MDYRIRRGRAGDAAKLVDIEQDAAQLFRSAAGLEWLADQPGTTAAGYAKLLAAGTVWVAESAAAACGFLAARVEGPELHVVELSVMREHQRRGLARKLVETAVVEARRSGLGAITLTTFQDLAWNELLYAKLGFVRLDGRTLSERLRAELEHDAEAGLPIERRCAMRLSLA
jgi:ribosomal protein S18 acetylase RimI-like enzyme